jgi:methylsterol monooxygenase
MAFVGNYASQFRWWDSIFGTDSGFRKWKQQRREERQATKAKAVKSQ